MAPVRREVFDKSNDKAIAPAAILFYQYANSQKTDDNVLEHITIKPTRFFSYFKIFTINRSDYKKVEQGLLKKNDWLLKTLVYGSYLDFNLIAHLKKSYSSIKDIISDKTKFACGTVVQYSKKPAYDATAFHRYHFVDAYAVEPYFVNPDKVGKFISPKVHRIRNQQIFAAPMLLIRKGPDAKLLIPKSAICEIDAVYKDTLTAVKVIAKSDINDLRNIEAVLHSDLYAYFAIHTFASIGIEREQLQNYDKFSVPYAKNNISLVEAIEKAKTELYNLKKQIPIDDIEVAKKQKIIDNAQNKINESILKTLNFNELEKSLLDYALTISRPLITRTQTNKYEVLSKLQKALSKQEIINYASVYLNRFKRNIDSNERKFVVQVWQTNQLLGMFFDVVSIDTPDENGIIWKKDATDEQILSLLIKLSSEKITDRLFVQKDIRGFEKERFYIFKPNEKRLWHKAIAYLDAEEFMDAILKAGRRGE